MVECTQTNVMIHDTLSGWEAQDLTMTSYGLKLLFISFNKALTMESGVRPMTMPADVSLIYQITVLSISRPASMFLTHDGVIFSINVFT